MNEALEAGAGDVLWKPVESDELGARIALAERQLSERRKLAEQQQSRADQLSTRAQQQVAVAALGQCALANVELETLIEQAMMFVLQMLSVEYAAILERAPNGETLRLRQGFGWGEGCLNTAQLAAGPDTAEGRAMQGEPVLISDWSEEARFRPAPLLAEHGIRSSLSVLIAGSKAPFGILAACSTRANAFTENDLQFLQGVAIVLSLAIERQRSEEAIRNSEAQLRQLQKLECVGQLSAGLAHDFNNVLTIIRGHADMTLLDKTLAARRVASLEKIVSAVDRASGLTRQLLTFSRRQVVQTVALDINDCLSSVVKMLDHVLGEHIELRFEPSDPLPAVMGDSGMLDQVIMNLAVNARDAMPKGGRLTLTTSLVEVDARHAQRHSEARTGKFVCINVTDTGTGMDEATLQRIFEPFFTTKGVGKGTGLGLATVQGIIQQHQGWVEVVSKVGQGTTFLLYLPGTDALARRSELDRADDIKGGHETILMVEDEPLLRELARLILHGHGYEVLEAR